MSGTYDLDSSVLARLQNEIGPTAAHAAVTAFRAEMSRRAPLLRDALAAGDPAAIRRLLHQIKGSALTFGATEIARLAAESEARARSGEPAIATDLAQQTALAIERTLAPCEVP